MATANDIIARAGRRVKILAGEEAFNGAEGTDALQLLNDMMTGFGPRGIGYVHTTLAASDTVNLPDEQLRNLVLMMARELAIDWGVAIDPALATEIMRAEQELQAAFLVLNPAVPDRALRRRRPGHYDFTRDV